MKVYRSLIRPVVTYGSETWNLLAADANKLRIFERKIIRRIWGAVNENGHWRIRTNMEIDDILGKEDIVRFVKSKRLRWLGHVERMMDTRATKRVYKARMSGRRRQGRPRSRWLDEAEADLRTMEVRPWRSCAQDRTRWREIVLQAKAHPGL